MAYEMHEWVCNEPITADKLNHIEAGIVDASGSGGGEESGTLIVRLEIIDGVETMDKTWAEIEAAFPNVRVTDEDGIKSMPVVEINNLDISVSIGWVEPSDSSFGIGTYTASSTDAHPTNQAQSSN